MPENTNLADPDEHVPVCMSLRRAASEIQLRPDLRKEGQGLLASVLFKAAGTEAPSASQSASGVVRRPFDIKRVSVMKQHNEQHSTCIEAKKAATVGLGHKNEDTGDKLDPLCRVSWLHTLLQVAEDFESLGNGFLEVVREGFKQSGKIIGLHWQPCVDIDIEVENNVYDFHFIGRTPLGNEQRFAAYGDLDSYRQRRSLGDDRRLTEIIHFSQPSSFSRWWGVPFWLAAVASIELVQALEQHQFDFHQNRGVPEFMMFFKGAQLRKEDWREVKRVLESQIGPGNSHKSLALNFADQNLEIQVEKLALENSADGEFFAKIMEVLSLHIVSAHRVPPSLGGILIPGKMGAANEMSNAIMAFQALLIKQQQKNFETTLRRTLGQDPSLGFEKDAFVFRTIIEEMAEAMEALKPADTMGRMRQELPEAQAEDRDLDEGLKKQAAQQAALGVLQKLFAGA